MKLAEALLLRSDLEKKLASLAGRITKYAIVQQGDKPHEDPKALLREHAAVLQQWRDLVVAINRTNLTVALPDGRTLTEALADRDALVKQHSLLTQTVDASAKEPERYGLSEIKWVATMKVPAIQKDIDALSKRLRELNTLLQEANWSVELLDLGSKELGGTGRPKGARKA